MTKRVAFYQVPDARALTGYAIPGSHGTGWTYGSVGSREKTAALLVEGRATPTLRTAFEAQRGDWEARVKALADAMPSRRTRLRFRDTGDIVDVGRYLSDRPDCWERRERGRALPSLTLACNVAISCGNGEAVFAEAAGAMAACTWALCAQGYPVRILVCAIGQNGWRREWVGAYYVAKDYGDPLDVERVLAAGMPGVMRDFFHGVVNRHLVGYSGDNCGLHCHAPPAEVGKAVGYDVMLSRSWPDTEQALTDALRMEGFERRA